MRHRSRKSEEIVWKREFIISDDLFPGKPVFKTLTSAVIHQTGIHWKFEKEMFQKQLPKYSGLNLNQYGVALPCRTICTVCGFVALSWFKFNPLYNRTFAKIPFPQQPKTRVWVSAVRERRILQRSVFASTEFKTFYIDFIFCISRFLPVSF